MGVILETDMAILLGCDNAQKIVKGCQDGGRQPGQDHYGRLKLLGVSQEAIPGKISKSHLRGKYDKDE